MMVNPMKVNRKPEIRASFSEFLFDVDMFAFTPEAEDELDILEDGLTQHLLSRGMDTSEIREKCRIIRFYLRERINAHDKKRIVQEKVVELLKSVNFNPIENPNSTKDPILLLKRLYTELKDDWSAFWKNPLPGVVDSIGDDLDAVEELEPFFAKDENEERYKQFRRILELRAGCYTQFPIMSAIGPGEKLTENQRKKIYEEFGKLFEGIAKLMAPLGFVYKEEGEEKLLGGLKVQDLTGG